MGRVFDARNGDFVGKRVVVTDENGRELGEMPPVTLIRFDRDAEEGKATVTFLVYFGGEGGEPRRLLRDCDRPDVCRPAARAYCRVEDRVLAADAPLVVAGEAG